MICKATVTFAGQVTMAAGEVRDVPEAVAGPLIGCGYLTPMEVLPTVAEEPAREEKAPKAKKEKPAAESEG